MRAVSRRNIIAVVVGGLLAGIPLFAFNYWLEGLIDRQGEVEVGTAAKRAIALAEARVRDTVGALDNLASRGVNSCAPGQIEAMSYAAFSTIPVKEVSVVGPDAQTLCTDLGLPLGERSMLSSELFVGAAGYWLDIIALPIGERMVRLRRQVASGPNGIAALVPATLFLPQVSTQGGPFSAYARIMTRQGNDHRRSRRKTARGGGCRFPGRDEVREIRLRRRNRNLARPHCGPACRSQMVRPARRRSIADRGDRYRRAGSAANCAKPDGRNRTCSRGQ